MGNRRNFDDDETEYFERENDNYSDGYTNRYDSGDSDDYTINEEDTRGGYDEDDSEKTINLRRKKPEILGFIVVKKGRRKNDKHDLTKNDIIIGKSQKCCDIVLDDDDVSKIHCRIRKDDDKNEFHFYDCGSTNGSMVNGQEVQHTILKSNDRITLGENVEVVFIQV